LHFYPSGYQKLTDQIKFRDKLNAERHLKERYEELKIQLARAYKFDREKYTGEKAEFIKSVLEK
jgi:GrpB-like predicted nucleotidyltransferase (UPF0157 family)